MAQLAAKSNEGGAELKTYESRRKSGMSRSDWEKASDGGGTGKPKKNDLQIKESGRETRGRDPRKARLGIRLKTKQRGYYEEIERKKFAS